MNSGDDSSDESQSVIGETSGVIRIVSKATSLVSARMHSTFAESGMTANRGDKPDTTGQSCLFSCGSKPSRFGFLDSEFAAFSILKLTTGLFLQQFLQQFPVGCITTCVGEAGGWLVDKWLERLGSHAEMNWHMHIPEGRSIGRIATRDRTLRTIRELLLRSIDCLNYKL